MDRGIVGGDLVLRATISGQRRVRGGVVDRGVTPLRFRDLGGLLLTATIASTPATACRNASVMRF